MGLAIPGGQNQIGEANVKITADISDLKSKVQDAKRETEKVDTGRGSRRRSNQRESGDGGEGGVTDLRRGLGIGIFIAGIATAFYKLGQVIREAILFESARNKAIKDSAELLETSAEEEVAARKRMIQDLQNEIAEFREGNFVTRIVHAVDQLLRNGGKTESRVQELIDFQQRQAADAATRLASMRQAIERKEELELLRRIEKVLQDSMDQQKRFTDQMIGSIGVSINRLADVVEFRGLNSTRR